RDPAGARGGHRRGEERVTSDRAPGSLLQQPFVGAASSRVTPVHRHGKAREIAMPEQNPLWKPSSERAAKTRMAQFMEHIRREYAGHISDYAGLHRWSIERPEMFWPEVWAFCGVKASRTWDEVL